MKRHWIAALVIGSVAVGSTGIVAAQDAPSGGPGFQQQVREALAGITKKLETLDGISERLEEVHTNTSAPPKWSPPNAPLVMVFAHNDENAPFQPEQCVTTGVPANQCVAEAHAFCDDMGYTAVAHVQKLRRPSGHGAWHLTGVICYVAAT